MTDFEDYFFDGENELHVWSTPDGGLGLETHPNAVHLTSSQASALIACAQAVQPAMPDLDVVAEALDDAVQTEIIGKTHVGPKDIAAPFLTALKARGYIVTREHQE